MKFLPDDEDDDDDSSSVVDISMIVNQSGIETLTPRPTEGANHIQQTIGNLKAPPESSDKSYKTEDTPQPIQLQETVRFIIGDSIIRWRDRSVQSNHSSNNILVWKQTTGNNNVVWQNSRVRVDGFQLSLETENGSSYVPKEVVEPETSAFVEAVAIWDASEKAYRLEIPHQMAIDVLARSRQGQSSLAEPPLAVVDPLIQARQAEEALRKRKRPTSMKRPVKRGSSTSAKSPNR